MKVHDLFPILLNTKALKKFKSTVASHFENWCVVIFVWQRFEIDHPLFRLHRKTSSARSKNVSGRSFLSKSKNILALEVGESSF